MPFDADQVLEVFSCATEENQSSALRVMQVVNLPGEGEVYMTGDLHDHRRNFDKLLKAVDLPNHPERHVILHELIHGDYFDATGADGSWLMLYRAAELKCDYPGQVHFLLANHDLAQVHGEGITKGGVGVCEAFNKGVANEFRERAGAVNVAITEFLLSLPLAIRAPNGLFFCHSLPADRQIETFDFTVFDRPLNSEDYARKTGPVYQLIWGRNVTPTGAGIFAEKVGAKLLITGHQPQDAGYAVNGPAHLIISSEHNQGVFVALSLSEGYEMADVVRKIKKFVAVE